MEHPPSSMLNLDYRNTIETGGMFMELVCVSGLFASVFVRLLVNRSPLVFPNLMKSEARVESEE